MSAQYRFVLYGRETPSGAWEVWAHGVHQQVFARLQRRARKLGYETRIEAVQS